MRMLGFYLVLLFVLGTLAAVMSIFWGPVGAFIGVVIAMFALPVLMAGALLGNRERRR